MNPKVTVAIPLYKSARFFENICMNIESEQSKDVEFLIADHHCFDDTIDRLEKRFSDDVRVKFIKKDDKLDWVGNINDLLGKGTGEYWRILPHDDISPAGSLIALIDALDEDQDAIVAYGPTKAIDLEGNRLPYRDKSMPYPSTDKIQWTLSIALEMFWKGYFDGAFKGLIRRDIVLNNQLFIKSTKDQIFPERCWLFALALLGKFKYVNNAVYIKRFYEGSVHSKWKITANHFFSAAHTMSKYLHEIIGFSETWIYGNNDIWYNALRRARWLDHPGICSNYAPFPSNNSLKNRQMSLPICK